MEEDAATVFDEAKRMLRLSADAARPRGRGAAGSAAAAMMMRIKRTYGRRVLGCCFGRYAARTDDPKRVPQTLPPPTARRATRSPCSKRWMELQAHNAMAAQEREQRLQDLLRPVTVGGAAVFVATGDTGGEMQLSRPGRRSCDWGAACRSWSASCSSRRRAARGSRRVRGGSGGAGRGEEVERVPAGEAAAGGAAAGRPAGPRGAGGAADGVLGAGTGPSGLWTTSRGGSSGGSSSRRRQRWGGCCGCGGRGWRRRRRRRGATRCSPALTATCLQRAASKHSLASSFVSFFFLLPCRCFSRFLMTINGRHRPFAAGRLLFSRAAPSTHYTHACSIHYPKPTADRKIKKKLCHATRPPAHTPTHARAGLRPQTSDLSPQSPRRSGVQSAKMAPMVVPSPG